MKKIPTLFEREFENHRIVRILPNISPDLAWVMAGDGVATIKWDGACCAVINGVFYKRYDAKHGKPIPSNAIKCQENADPVTGHLPCWVPCNRAVPFPVSWTVKMKKKQKETQDILSYHSQAAGCSDKARAKASGGRQPIEECGRTGL